MARRHRSRLKIIGSRLLTSLIAVWFGSAGVSWSAPRTRRSAPAFSAPLHVIDSSFGGPAAYTKVTLSRGQAGYMRIDTGSPTTFLTASAGKRSTGVSVLGRDLKLPTRVDVNLDEIVNGIPVVGIVGTDLLTCQTTMLDFKKGRICFYNPGTPTDVRQAHVLPFEIRDQRLVVTVAVDGRRKRLLFDTGSPDTTLFRSRPRPNDQKIMTKDATGKEFPIYVSKADMRYADFHRTDDKVSRVPAWPYFEQVVKQLGGDVRGLFGIESLPNGRVIIDAENQRLVFPR